MGAAETWTAGEQATLVRMAAEGARVGEIASALGKTRNAVIGRARRTRIALLYTKPPAKPKPPSRPRVEPHTPEVVAKVRQMYAEGATYTSINAETGVQIGSIGFMTASLPRRRAPTRSSAYERSFRVMAVAAHLCGKSYPKVARQLGCSKESLVGWGRRPDIRAAAQAVADRVTAEFAAKAAAVAARKAQEASDRRALADEINAPILARMPARHRAMMERRLDGSTLKGVGDDFGVTRERVRQIEVKWRLQGLVIPGAKPLSEASRRAVYVPTGAPRGRKPRGATVKAGAYWSEKVNAAFSGVAR